MIQAHEFGDVGLPLPRLTQLVKVEATIVLGFMLPVHKVAQNPRDKGAKGFAWRTSCNHSQRAPGLGKVWGRSTDRSSTCAGSSALIGRAQLSICSRQIREEAKLYVGPGLQPLCSVEAEVNQNVSSRDTPLQSLSESAPLHIRVL